MTFTPDAAGTMAQILAVLLLATALAPDIRGAMTKDKNGDYGPLRSAAFVRLLAAIIALIVISLDSVVLMLATPAEGTFAQVLALLNAGSLGMLFTSTIYTFTNHVRHDPSKNPRGEPSDDHE